MSFFFSNDDRYVQSQPSNVNAARKIQRWWRKSKETIVFRNSECQTSESSETSQTSSSDNSMYVNTSGLRKRKLDEIDSDNYEASAEQEESYEESYEESDIDEEDNQIATVNNNNFLWDFFASFFSFFMRLFGLN